MSHDLRDGDVLSVPQIQKLAEWIFGGWDENRCPDRGTYTIGPIGGKVECSVHGHPWTANN